MNRRTGSLSVSTATGPVKFGFRRRSPRCGVPALEGERLSNRLLGEREGSFASCPEGRSLVG